MQPPAITVIFLQDGRAVQTAGLDTPVDQQIETLAEAGRLNCSPVPGAIRGEVWISGQVRARTFFEPVAAPDVIETAPATEPTPDEIRRAFEALESQLAGARAQAEDASAVAAVLRAELACVRAELTRGPQAVIIPPQEPVPGAADSTQPKTIEEVEPRADVPGLADAPGTTSSPSSSPPPVSGKRKSS